MSFRSNAPKINAGNYVQIKQEAYSNQALPNDLKATKPSAPSPHFGPFQPRKTTDVNNVPAIGHINNPPTKFKSIPSKMVINPPMYSNGLGKGSNQETSKPSSNIPLNAPTTFKTKPSKQVSDAPMSLNGLGKGFKQTTLKPSSNTYLNAPPTSIQSPCTDFITNQMTSSNETTKYLDEPIINYEFISSNKLKNVPCKQMHVDTQILGEDGQTKNVGNKPCNEGEDDIENNMHANVNGAKLRRGRKRVWKPCSKVIWTDDIVVDPDEVV